MNEIPEANGETTTRQKAAVWLFKDFRLITLLLVLGTIAFVYIDSVQSNNDIKEAVAKIEASRKESRNQNCRGAEAAHQQEIKEINRQYKILVDPTPAVQELLKSPLILQGILDEEQAARFDTDALGIFVAPFCDNPGLGLPEPDPEVPQRPAEVEALFDKLS